MSLDYHLMEEVCGVLIMILLEMLLFLALIIVHHLILTIAKIFFSYQVKVQLLELMENLVQQRKSLVLILQKQIKQFCLSLHYNAANSYLFVNEK